MSWRTVALGDVCKVIAGQSPEGKYYNNDGVGIPFYQGKKDFGKVYINPPSVWTTEITKEAIKDDILMSVRAPVGPVNISRENICIGRGLAAIRSSEKIDKSYLFNYLLSIEKDLIGSSGAVFNSINKGQIEKLEIPLPPLATQQKIVAKLDAIFAEIDKAMAAAEANAKNAEALFQSYLNQVFESGGDGWITTVLDKVCKVDRGSSPRPIKDYFTDSEDGVNWVKIGDTEEGGKYIFSTKQKITKSGAEKSRYVEVGDFILTNSMSYGRPYIMRINGYIHDGWFVLRLNDDVDSEYFYYLLTSPYVQKQFQQLAAGSVVKNISGDLVKKTILPMPKLGEQKRLADIFTDKQTILKRLSEVFAEKKVELNLLRQSILRKAFAGELVKE